MLERIEAEEGDAGYVFARRVHTEDAARLTQGWEHAYLLP
jgi:hypothetical protein